MLRIHVLADDSVAACLGGAATRVQPATDAQALLERGQEEWWRPNCEGGVPLQHEGKRLKLLTTLYTRNSLTVPGS